MQRKMLKSKIHRATVTEANVNYEGSITIPPALLDLSDIRAYESVHVWNVTRGTRFETYAITGESESRSICVNGAAAHLVEIGDLVIIASFVSIDDAELATFEPKIVFVDKHNNCVESRAEKPGPYLAEEFGVRL